MIISPVPTTVPVHSGSPRIVGEEVSLVSLSYSLPQSLRDIGLLSRLWASSHFKGFASRVLCLTRSSSHSLSSEPLLVSPISAQMDTSLE